jgi:hypothetical protein
VITAGWQVALIAVSAAVVAAAVAVYLDRALTARRAGLVIAARRPGADPACPAGITPDTSLLPAAASGTADIVEFGRNLTR